VQTLVFEMFGVCGLLVQTVVLRYMLKWLGEARVLTVGLTAALLEMLLVSFITAKWQVGTGYSSRCVNANRMLLTEFLHPS
jgi:hypothetical protein